MPPKSGVSQAQKLEKILQYLHDSATCHTLKDLEKSIPTATKVNKMQVKDLLQELTDTDQVKVEKIGSGNWYWAWAGEELSERKAEAAKLEEDENGLQKSIAEMESHLTHIKADQTTLQDHGQLRELVDQIGPLEDEVRMLSTEKDAWECAVTGGIDDKRVELEMLKTEVAELTNNIWVLEESLKRSAGLDKDGLTQLRMQCYGDSFIEGEELIDIDEI